MLTKFAKMNFFTNKFGEHTEKNNFRNTNDTMSLSRFN